MNAQTIISSPQNSQIQLVRKLLSQSKARQREQAFVAEGVRLIQDGLRSGFPVRTMFKKENASPLAEEFAAGIAHDHPISVVQDKFLKNLAIPKPTGSVGGFEMRSAFAED